MGDLVKAAAVQSQHKLHKLNNKTERGALSSPGKLWHSSLAVVFMKTLKSLLDVNVFT